jgi:hypothetical protein
VFIGFPLSLTLSPLLRRGEREFTTRCRLSHSLLSTCSGESNSSASMSWESLIRFIGFWMVCVLIDANSVGDVDLRRFRTPALPVKQAVEQHKRHLTRAAPHFLSSRSATVQYRLGDTRPAWHGSFCSHRLEYQKCRRHSMVPSQNQVIRAEWSILCVLGDGQTFGQLCPGSGQNLDCTTARNQLSMAALA